MSSSSICSGYRYESQKPFLMYQKPLQFSWFSTALKNIKETNGVDSKDEKKSEENRTILVVSSTTTVNDKCTTTELKTDDERSEFTVDRNEELKSTKAGTTVSDNVGLGLSNTISSYKLNYETHRKSLTAMYLEKKNLSEEVTEELQEGSYSSGFSDITIIKDKGPDFSLPVRQSLLSLVMDEDVPELMEAMAEKLEFVFEDLTPSVSSACEGILRNSAKRPRSRPREARLEFHSSSPTVFTYPDEESAVEKAQWDEGKLITFTVYRELCEGKKEPIDDNQKVQNFLQPSQMANNAELSYVRSATLMEEPSMAESLLGVTGRISYNNAPIDLARFNKNTV
uniref:Protein KAKU4-like n=1 Tax=Elaeophora elaphi TaxID=1147741 RepID=A0A0R3RTP7_9BILA